MRALKLLFARGTTPYAPTSPPPPPPPPPGAPNAPTNLALTSQTATTVTLSYTDNSSDEDGFYVYADGVQKGSAAANATSITATGLTEGTQYDFTVTAYNGSGESPDSNTVTAYTKLATPTGFYGQDLGTFIRFSWADNSSNESEYVLDKNGSDYGSVGANVTTYDVDEADASGTFKVQARASGIPSSDYSGTASGPPWPT